MSVQQIIPKGGSVIDPKQFLMAVLAEMVGQGAAGLFSAARSNVEPMVESGGQGSKYMITLPEAQRLELAFASENFRRSMMGLPPLDSGSFIANREAALRESAAQAGERELARKMVEVGGNVSQEALKLAGTQAQATSGLGQQLAQNYFSRPSIYPGIEAVSTGR
jgi:hypothetical protein